MSINIDSESACRKAYLNYHCYGNTMGISSKEMGEITSKWENKLKSWQNTVAKDENEYEFDDSSFKESKQQGANKAKEETGFDGNKGKNTARVVGDLGTSVGSTVVSTALPAITKSSAGATASWIAGCVLGAATATLYFAKKPNKEQKKACDELQTILNANQEALQDEQTKMEKENVKTEELADNANEANEEANDTIEDQKTEHDFYMRTVNRLKAKADSGKKLTKEERDLYKDSADMAASTVETIDKTSDATTNTVADIYDEMSKSQDVYDYSAETIAEVEGITDYAESFDETTKKLCYTEAAAQGINAASSAWAAAKGSLVAASGGWITALWAAPIVALGLGGVAGSRKAASQQIKWAGQVNTEIDIRKQTQDLNNETNDIYTENIDGYDGLMAGVDQDLNTEMPEDLSVPEEKTLPETSVKTDNSDDKDKKLKENKQE